MNNARKYMRIPNILEDDIFVLDMNTNEIVIFSGENGSQIIAEVIGYKCGFPNLRGHVSYREDGKVSKVIT